MQGPLTKQGQNAYFFSETNCSFNLIVDKSSSTESGLYNIKKKYSFLKFISLFIISFFLNSFLNIILKYNRKRLYNIMKSFSKIKR